MRGIDQALGGLGVDARQADIEPGLQEIGAAGSPTGSLSPPVSQACVLKPNGPSSLLRHLAETQLQLAGSVGEQQK